MKDSLRSYVPLAGFASALALLLFAGLSSFLDAQRLADTTAEVDAAHGILERLDQVSITVERIVSNTRVFVITADEGLIDSIDEARRVLGNELDALSGLLQGSDQIGTLMLVRDLLDERLALNDQYIELRRRSTLQETTDQIQPGGEQLAGEIRRGIDDMAAAIRLRIAESRRIASESHADTLVEIALLGSISLVILIATFIGYRRQAVDRDKLEREVIAVGELERERIALDLHDSLGQELTGLSLRLETLSKALEQEHSPHAAAARSLSTSAQQAISQARQLSRSLAPGVWAELGICRALEALSREVDNLSGVRCQAFCAEEDDIHDSEVVSQLYRIAQEAVNNALRHADASNVELHFGRSGTNLSLRVLDDGVGIPTGKRRTEGLGLRSMRHRARIINGHLDALPRASGGTKIVCSIARGAVSF